MMVANIAQGLNRQLGGLDAWRGHKKALWLAEVEEARERRTKGLANMTNRLYGFDIDYEQINAAQKNAYRAGLSGHIHLEKRDVEQLRISQDSIRSEEHTSELQSRPHLVCRLQLEKTNN